MNTGNTEAFGPADGSYDDSRSVPESEVGAAGSAVTEARYTREQQENFRRNREESLKLCESFRAFYVANPAYHLAL